MAYRKTEKAKVKCQRTRWSLKQLMLSQHKDHEETTPVRFPSSADGWQITVTLIVPGCGECRFPSSWDIVT
ncbi:hypothetical protein QQF64_019217 [Cirrhinus molitorella]|uniref:Uncharacterized protein n=1 Tax=Cirrhinus molitorella TaxID=172907 RepID=A0ABR3LEV1_9TELE